jgi:4-amino-4-deoxy-L-arabinose transferase-like glycosyltransferase
VYLLLAPVQFLKAGRLIHIPWNVLTNGPMALQLTFGMSWIADTTGGVFKLLMTCFGCLAVLAAARIGSATGVRTAIVSALFVAVYPEFWIHQTFGVVDLTIAGFVVFGAVWWLEALRKENWKFAILPGMAFGFATASRYQGAVLVPWIIAGTFAAESIRHPKLIRGSIKKGLVVAAIIVAMVLPWLLRNYFIFGNPVFPLLPGLLGGTEWSVEQARGLHQEVMGPTLTELPLRQIMVAPINALLMFPSNGLLGIAMLIGGLMAVFWWNGGGKPLFTYAMLGLGGVIIWGLIHPSPGVQLLRFNAASIILLLACTGAVLGSDRLNPWKGIYLATILALGSAVIAIIDLTSLVPVLPSLSSSNARAQIWQANVPSWRVMGFANDRLDPARHKVLFIGETRAVWLKTPFIAPSALNGAQLLDLFSPNIDPASWAERLRHMGVTHILICNSEWQRLADGYGYFRLSDEHLSRFYQWLHTLPLVFDDHHGNVLLSV